MEKPAASANAASPGLLVGVTPYHWLVVIIASCGWLFDCMDQRLFTMARESSLRDLLGSDPSAQTHLESYLGLATGMMMVGWATGGIIFGMLSDKWGRVKTMVATLLVYSGCTGLCGLASGWVDFVVYRFLVGLGVGGMFGAATTLVAESVPARFRTVALGSLQALSASGNIVGSYISYHIPPGAEHFAGGLAGWRVLFFVGILPALLVVPILGVLKEPEMWKKAKAEAASGAARKQIGSPAQLFRHARWRRNTLVGLCLGVSGMAGLWAIGFFAPELVTTALKETPLRAGDVTNAVQLAEALGKPATAPAQHLRQQLRPDTAAALDAWVPGRPVPEALAASLREDLNRVIIESRLHEAPGFGEMKLKKGTQKLLGKVQQKATPGDVRFLNRQLIEQAVPDTVKELQKYIDGVRSKAMMLMDVGSFLGMLAFTAATSWLNRRRAFLGAFALCLGVTGYVFYSLKTETDAYWMLPMMGFAQLSVFAGYSIYFPELYPTRLRGTGVGFCYNTVRYLAAPFPYLLGQLSGVLSFRTAAIAMSSIYLPGAVALIWAPETKGKPLPEDEPA